MNAALWGLMTALGWGSADFIARFTGRAMGHHVALFGMLSVGAVVLTLTVWLSEAGVVWDLSGWWLLALTGVGIMVATLLLYWGLARGPVTLVAPIVGSYPALNVILALALGVRPAALEWLAMAAVMVGVVIVARSAKAFELDGAFTSAHLRRTILISLASAVGFAVAIAAAQGSIVLYGELQAVMLGRWISLASIVVVLLWRRKPVHIPARWWPLLALQGLLDGGAYVALLAGSGDEGAVITVVVASAFSAVTVLLARAVLREAMSWPQWAGIAIIVAGVVCLSAIQG